MAFRSDRKFQLPTMDTRTFCSGMIVRMGLLGRKGLELSVVGIEPSPHCSGVQASKRIGTILRIRLLMKADAMRSSDDGSLFLAVIKKQVFQANSSKPIG